MKFTAAVAAVVICAVCLAACGGGDDSASTQPAATDTESSSAAATPTTESPSGGSTDADDGEGSSNDESSADSPSGDAGDTTDSEERSADKGAPSIPPRGTVSSNSASFQKYSGKGKLHLAEFGEESSSDSLGEVSELVGAYLQASGEGEWEKACTYLLAEVKAQLAELMKQATKGESGDSCGAALEAATKAFSVGNDSSSIYASEGISSLRIQEGGRAGEGAGFALFHGSDGEDHWIAVKRQNGAWKILSSTPQPFR